MVKTQPMQGHQSDSHLRHGTKSQQKEKLFRRVGVDGLEEAEGFWRERGVAFQAEEMAATQLAGDPQGSHELCAHFPT